MPLDTEFKTVYQLSEHEFERFLDSQTTNHKRKYKAQRKFELNVVLRSYSFHDSYEYHGAQVRSKLVCPFGHEYDALPRAFSGKKQIKCSSCTGNSPLKAKKEFEQAVKDRSYKLSSTYKYINAKVRTDIICPKGTLFAVAPYSFTKSGTNCACCLENNKSWIEAKKRFEQVVVSKGFRLCDGYKYVTASEVVNIYCENNHLLVVTPSNFKNQLGCKYCRAEKLQTQFEELVVTRGYAYPADYIYVNTTTEVKLTCPKGTSYLVSPIRFKNVLHGCPCCDGQDKAIAKRDFEQYVLDREYSFQATYNYINARTKVALICPKGTSFDIAPDTFKNQGVGCACCALKRLPCPETQKRFEDLVIRRGYSFHSDYQYQDSNRKVLLICPEGTAYLTAPNNFIHGGRGCMCCQGRLPEQQQSAFEKMVIERGYSFAESYNYINAKKRVDLLCSKGNLYKAYPTGFKMGTGCACCSDNGFQPDREGYLYLQELWLDDVLTAYKFGITNREPSERLKEHDRGSVFNHVLTEHKIHSFNGQDVWDLERIIKNEVPTRFVSRTQMEDGWTETIHPRYLDNIISIIESSVF
jgi:hypothetical protein